MKLVVHSYASQGQHYLVVEHEEGQGYVVNGTSTTIGRFPSRRQAEEAKEALTWFGDHRFTQGVNFERHWNTRNKIQGSDPE